MESSRNGGYVTPGGAQVSSDEEDDRRMFLGLKCSIPECFGWFDLSVEIFWVF